MNKEKKLEATLKHFGYEPEQVKLRGKILIEALIQNQELREEIKGLKTKIEKVRKEILEKVAKFVQHSLDDVAVGERAFIAEEILKLEV
jgi:septum formation topological specificity factor MinE